MLPTNWIGCLTNIFRLYRHLADNQYSILHMAKIRILPLPKQPILPRCNLY